MIILLPPSEGKSWPVRGKPLDLAGLSAPELLPQRRAVLTALTSLCGTDPQGAIDVLGLGPTQFDLVAQDADLEAVPTSAAGLVYSGVLYAALDYPGIQGEELRRANRRLRIVSALFGLLNPRDRIPAYRLSGNAKLPGVGSLPAIWREALSAHVAAEPGLVLDLLSSPYSSMVRLPPDAVTAKIWQDGPGGQRTAVSHFNKATKGQLARFLATSPEQPRSGGEVVELLTADGWEAELAGSRVDVMMRS